MVSEIQSNRKNNIIESKLKEVPFANILSGPKKKKKTMGWVMECRYMFWAEESFIWLYMYIWLQWSAFRDLWVLAPLPCTYLVGYVPHIQRTMLVLGEEWSTRLRLPGLLLPQIFCFGIQMKLYGFRLGSLRNVAVVCVTWPCWRLLVLPVPKEGGSFWRELRGSSILQFQNVLG